MDGPEVHICNEFSFRNSFIRVVTEWLLHSFTKRAHTKHFRFHNSKP